MATYVVHPGYVTPINTNIPEYVDAGTLAAYYGLTISEYEVGTSQQAMPATGVWKIHLYPRQDGRYRNIKTELGDNGTDSYIDKEVGWKEKRRRRFKIL